MDYKHLIYLILFLTGGSQAYYDQQIFLFPNDVFTLQLDSEFPTEKNKLSNALSQPSKKYTSNSPLASITTTGQLAGEEVGEDCFITNQFTSSNKQLWYAFACNNGAKLFTWDATSMKFTKLQEVISTNQQQDVYIVEDAVEDILATVSAASTAKGAHLYIDQSSSKLRSISQIDISQESWDKTQQFTDLATIRTAPVKDGVNNLNLGLVFQRGNPGVVSSSYLAFFEIGGTNYGSVLVNKAESGFNDDVTRIYDIQVSADAQIIITYSSGSSDALSISTCALTYTSQTPSLKFNNCKAVKSPSLSKIYSSVVDLGGQNSAAWIFDPSQNTISRCSYDRTVPEIKACVATNKIPIPNGLTFSRFEFSPLGTATAEFISGNKSVNFIVYGINAENFLHNTDGLALTQFQRNGVLGVVKGSTALLSGDTGVYRAIISASEIKDQISSVTITRTSDKVTYTISAVLVPTINDYTFIGEFPLFQGYTNRLAQLPIFREGFAGNNLKFSSSNPNIEFVFNKQFTLNKPVPEGAEVRLLSANMGLAIDHNTNTITKLVCEGDYILGNSYACSALEGVNYILGANEKILLAQNNHFIEQTGIILITSDGKQVTLTFLGDNQQQIFSKILKVEGITDSKNVLFKMSDAVYGFYIINQAKNTVDLYTSLTKELDMMNDTPKYVITDSDAGIPGNFCPQSLTVSPMDLPLVEVLSFCKDIGQSVIYSFDLSKFIDEYEVPLMNTKILNTDPSFVGDYPIHFCSLGDSFVIFDSIKQEITLQSRHTDESKIYFRLDELGVISVDSLHCVFENLMAVVIGKTKDSTKNSYTVISGNYGHDARNRIITSGLFDSTASVSIANGRGDDLNINFFKDTSSHAYIPRRGPLTFYTSDGKETSNIVTISIATTDGTLNSKDYILAFSDYDTSVAIAPIAETPSSIQTVNIDKSVGISGPLLGLDVTVDKSVTVTPKVTGRVFKKETQQKASNTPAIPNPDRLRIFGNLGIGFQTRYITTKVYFYNNYTEFNFMTDIGCVAVSRTALNAAVSGNLVFTAAACKVGGRISLRYLIQDYTNQQIATRGIINDDLIADHLFVTNPDSNTFAVLAINERDSIANTFIVEIGQTSNAQPLYKQEAARIGKPLLVYDGFNVTLTTGPSFNGVTFGSIFSVGQKFVVLSSGLLTQNIKATVIDLSGNILNSNWVDLPGGYMRVEMDCGASNGQCILFNSGTIIQDVKFILDDKSNSVSLASTLAYYLYSDFFVSSWAFSDDLLMTRAVSQEQKEIILFYKRDGSHGSNPWWGLDSSIYSAGGVTDAIFTKFVSNKEDIIQISTSTISSTRLTSGASFTSFSMGDLTLTLTPPLPSSSFQNVTLTFNSGVAGASPTSYALSSFFRAASSSSTSSPSKPATGPSVPTWAWVLIGAVIVLLILGFGVGYVLFKQQKENEEDDDEDGQGFYSTQKVQEKDTMKQESLY